MARRSLINQPTSVTRMAFRCDFSAGIPELFTLCIPSISSWYSRQNVFHLMVGILLYTAPQKKADGISEGFGNLFISEFHKYTIISLVNRPPK